jgi:hypothetical protein
MAGGAPVREGNSVEILIEGEAAFAAMLAAIQAPDAASTSPVGTPRLTSH